MDVLYPDTHLGEMSAPKMVRGQSEGATSIIKVNSLLNR